ncbi:MAG: WecB/TagA/CpsF family glycosyltransferase [Caldilineaceae bacterium]|nr:WecB/TagA/CpsF family glycosyltransferase [Caldilineaceae bacterium]
MQSDQPNADTSLLPSLPHEPVNVTGVNITPVSVDELHQYMAAVIAADQSVIIPNVNVYALNLAAKEPWLKEFFNQAPLVFCDGTGVILGARLLGQKIPERITYADWMWQLGAFAAERGYSFFLLGSDKGIAQKAAESMQSRIPDLKIAGWHHGYFDKRPDSAENMHVLALINQAKPDILVIGFGMPLQEHWLMENWDGLNVHIALTGGAVFDYVSGTLQRAPTWMTNHGLEWLGRMLIEPGRLWKRYVIGNPTFLTRVLNERMRR